MKHIAFNISLVLSVVISITSGCKKDSDKYCAPDLAIYGPSTFVEGEDFTLGPTHLPKEIAENTNYYWKYANMDGYNILTDGMTSVYDASPITIQSGDIRDQGTYTFRMRNDGIECSDMIASKEVQMIPKTCPCFDNLPMDTLIVDESFSTGTIYQPFTSVLQPDPWGSTFDLQLYLPMFTYDMQFNFDVPVPDYSSTYSLRNFYQNYYESNVPYDEFIQAYVTFTPSNEGADTYRLVDNQQNVYVKRVGNTLYITFCDLLFTHKLAPTKTITVSGKTVVNL